MIFASLGTMNIAFNRMAKAVDEWAAITKDEVIVQTGYTDCLLYTSPSPRDCS